MKRLINVIGAFRNRIAESKIVRFINRQTERVLESKAYKFARDKFEHVLAMAPLYILMEFLTYGQSGPAQFAAPTAVTIAGLMIEIREGEAFKWYSGKRGTFGLKVTFFGIKRSLGLRPENHSRDSLWDWLIPALVAWALTITPPLI